MKSHEHSGTARAARAVSFRRAAIACAAFAAMTALNAATLPDRLKAKQDVFVAQRTRLSKALDGLVALVGSKNEPKIREAIELLHMEYEKLEKVF